MKANKTSNMKKNNYIKSHIGTLEAAQYLEMSIGSIQRLMDDGILSGYLTPGGHRRISIDAIKKYQNEIGMFAREVSGLSRGGNIIEIVSEDKKLIESLQKKPKLDFIKIISSPKDLLFHSSAGNVKFIDYDFLMKYKFLSSESEMPDLFDTIIYSKVYVAEEISKNIKIHEINMTIDFIEGYYFAKILNY